MKAAFLLEKRRQHSPGRRASEQEREDGTIIH